MKKTEKPDRCESPESSCPRCAQSERLVRLLVCQSRIPFQRIAEVLGFEDTEAFARWCELSMGHPPRDLREQATCVVQEKLEMKQLRQALLSTFDAHETRRLISVLDPSS